MMDLRLALNMLSDVVQNRPPPLREFDQIYMKIGDMVIQAEFVARKYEGDHVVFLGDGDSISLSTMHLAQQGILDYGPSLVTVLDFDERIVNSINRFASHNNLDGKISAQLYNVADPLPNELIGCADTFYTNPPWGASNNGSSVIAFLQRGFEATGDSSRGIVVIADDPNVLWTQEVLANVQRFAIDSGFAVTEMIPSFHSYHLDDNPDLRSCTLTLSCVSSNKFKSSESIDDEAMYNFYGRGQPMKIRYIRELENVAPGTAHPQTYRVEEMEL